MNKKNDLKQENVSKEKEWYRERICDMVSQIDNETDLKMIYGMAKAAYNGKK